jgi:hypothetical protein
MSYLELTNHPDFGRLDGDMRRIGEYFDEVIAGKQGALSEQQQQVCEDVYGLIRDWAAGSLELEEVRDLAGAAWVIWKVLRVTPRTHDCFPLILEWCTLFDEKVRGPFVIMNGHRYSERDIRALGGKLTDTMDPVTGEVIFVPVWPIGFGKRPDGSDDPSAVIFGLPSVPQPEVITGTLERERPQGYSIWYGVDDADELDSE